MCKNLSRESCSCPQSGVWITLVIVFGVWIRLISSGCVFGTSINLSKLGKRGITGIVFF
jgi:hypothetical protein